MNTLQTPQDGDEAYEFIQAFKHTVSDETTTEPIQREFPWAFQESSPVYLARTGDNDAGAFKWRGAFLGATAIQNDGGTELIVPSAGNHARGAVLAAKALGMRVHVFVPESAPPLKKEGIQKLHSSTALRIHAVGASFDETLESAMDYVSQGSRLLHPFDDPYVARGQGTIVDDVLHNHPDTARITLPVGGGGLAAGIIHRLDELGRDDIHVTGMLAAGSNSLAKSLATDKLAQADSPNRRYGGSAVRIVGEHALKICSEAYRQQRFDLLEVTDEHVLHLTDLYDTVRRDNLRTSTPHYEPTSLVAVAGTQLLHDDIPTVVIGTGHNDMLYPRYT